MGRAGLRGHFPNMADVAGVRVSMMERTPRGLLGIVTVTVALLASGAGAQQGYQIGENGATANAGPVRMARVSYVTGPVTWRPTDSGGWSRAARNLPLRQG